MHSIVGGRFAHYCRRLIHLLMAIIPVLYYWYGDNIQQILLLNAEQIISMIIFLIMILEYMRLRTGLVLFGQREYERTQISALAWTIFSVGIVLLIAPKFGVQQAAIGAPLIWSLAIVDPLLGELRKFLKKQNYIISIGLIMVALIWLTCSFYLRTPWWFIFFIAPVTIFGETYKIKFIDDNALILLLPLAMCLLLWPFMA